MRPDLDGKVFDKQSDQKSRMDKGTKDREASFNYPLASALSTQAYCYVQCGLNYKSFGF